MKYTAKGFSIHSENSAKPLNQASGYVLDVIKSMGPFKDALDYGCGKLRYTEQLARVSGRVTIVDSETQLARTQDLNGHRDNIRSYVKTRLPSVRVLNIEEFASDRRRYDFVFCANVLSAIPNIKDRVAVVRSIADRLTAQGSCLFICQHSNSYFLKQMNDESVVKYGDGFIKGSKRRGSFYGIIPPERLRQIVTSGGLEVTRSWVNNQSGFVVAKKR